MEDIEDGLERAFGQQVRKFRLALGWTQADLAQRLTDAGFSMHQTTIAKMESGSRPTTINEAAELAAIFKVPIEVMLGSVFESQNAQRLRELESELTRLHAEMHRLFDERMDIERRISELHSLIDTKTKRVADLRKDMERQQNAESSAFSQAMHPSRHEKRNDE